MKKTEELIQAKSFGKLFTFVFIIIASYGYYKNLYTQFYIFLSISLIFLERQKLIEFSPKKSEFRKIRLKFLTKKNEFRKTRFKFLTEKKTNFVKFA